MRPGPIRSGLAGMVLLGVACGSPPPVVPAAAPRVSLPQSPVSRLFPLIEGTQWAYDAEEVGTGNKGIFVTRARWVSGARFSLVTGQRAHTVEARTDGIARLDTGTYLLRAPLSLGAEWPGDGGALVRVTAVDRVVDVPAGQFVGCVDTLEEVRSPSGEPRRRITTTYCPDVGIVSLYAEGWDGAKHSGERAVLRSFGKPVTLE